LPFSAPPAVSGAVNDAFGPVVKMSVPLFPVVVSWSSTAAGTGILPSAAEPKQAKLCALLPCATPLNSTQSDGLPPTQLIVRPESRVTVDGRPPVIVNGTPSVVRPK